MRRILASIALVAAFLVPAFALPLVAHGQSLQQRPSDIQTGIIIPGERTTEATEGAIKGAVRDMAEYVGVIYNFLISVVGVLAGIMLMIGGFQYLTSGGDASRAKKGKERIVNAIAGVVLALSSFIILNTINPQLVNLKMPEGIKPIEPVFAFMPFCDDLAKELNVDVTTYRKAAPPSGAACGGARYYEVKTGTATVRRWCFPRTAPCAPDSSYNGFTSPSVCMPINGITATDVEKDFVDNKGRLSKPIAQCQSCVGFTDGVAQHLKYAQGDFACQAWQNVANNGNATNPAFKRSAKATAIGSIGGAGTMYYCGYSREQKRCVFTEINCAAVSDCASYDDFKMQYCDVAGSPVIDCHYSGTLGSGFFNSGNAVHLGAVCVSDPCEKTQRCGLPTVAGIAASVGIEGTGALRGATLGFAGSITCENK